MANTVVLKNSPVVNKEPLITDLVLGELALNTADGKIYMRLTSDAIVDIVDHTSATSATEIKVSYESNADTNAFTDTLLSKVNGIEANATADQTFAQILSKPTTITGFGLTDAYTKAEIEARDAAVISGIDWKEAVATFADLATTYPTPTEGWTASVNDVDTVYRYDGSTWVVLANGTVPLATAVIDGKLSSADFTKLAGIEANATADQTATEILIAIKTVDGTGTELDADLLDGEEGIYYAPQGDTYTKAEVDSAISGSGGFTPLFDASLF